MGNHFKTLILMIGLTVLFVILGEAIAGEQGLYFAFFLAVILNFSAYWFSDRLAITMTRSRPLKESEAPELYDMVQKLTQKANLPMPRLYIMPASQPNAFATGRNPNNALISVTDGLLRLLNREEIEGVLAHELAHIQNRDILISSIAAVMAGALTMIARIGMWQTYLGGGRRREGGNAGALLQIIAIILAPIAALLIRMAISRAREYQADATAADITGKPSALANALLRLQQGARHQPYEVNEAAAHMFIVNPLAGRRGTSMAHLFSTHPPIEDRVRRLQQKSY